MSQDIPEPVARKLNAARETLTTPEASILMANAAVDASLKEKGLTTGNLYPRIEEAVNKHILTPGMAEWAHEIRLDSNDMRHADPGASMPTVEDAQRCLDFAEVIAENLFVLPARVSRGRVKPTP